MYPNTKVNQNFVEYARWQNNIYCSDTEQRHVNTESGKSPEIWIFSSWNTQI